MKIRYLFSSLIVLLMACKAAPDKAKVLTDIKALEKTLGQSSIMEPTAARKLIEQFQLYASSFPSDTASVGMLCDAGVVASNIGDFKGAIALYEQVSAKAGDNQKAQFALVLKGLLYENNLQDKAKAKAAYSEFLQKYPKHPLAARASELLQYVDIDASKIIEQAQQKAE